MEKKILLIAVYFTLAGSCVTAQDKSKIPPPPPAPPAPTEQFVAPPPPPAPSLPPPPLPIGYAEFTSREIINSNGYDIAVKNIKGTPVVVLKKDAITQKVKLSTWNTNRKFYEKKYGHLPPPPPPALKENMEFDAPKLVPDTQ